MNRAVVLAATLAAGLVLGGCTATPAAKPSPSIPNYSDQISPATYLKLMRTVPDFAKADDAALVRVAGSACAVMRKDGWQQVMQAFSVSGHDLEQSYAAVQYAVAAYCPDLLQTIPAQ